MPAHLPGSALALDDAIGDYRAALAERLGLAHDTIDLWVVPPADFTPQGKHNRGRRNPLDELGTIARCCPNGLAALKWLADQLGYRLVPKATTPHAGELLVEPANLAGAVDVLLTELNRRKPKMSDEQVAHLAETIADDLAALVADRLARRKAAQ